MAKFIITQVSKKPVLNNPILIEGLPGIGNVGKIAADFIVEETKAVKLYEITSYSFPHSVFVNEDNLAELPSVEIFYKKFDGKDKRDIIIISGDVQPVDEESSYEFSDRMLDIAQELKSNEIITLGGIGLGDVPKNPKVYCTGNFKSIIKKYKDDKVIDKLYGVVGPIIGVSGLMLGLATRRKVNAVSLLAETYGHPMYLGISGARQILNVLNSKLDLHMDLKKLDEEIKDMEKEILKKTEELNQVAKVLGKKARGKGIQEMNYIG